MCDLVRSSQERPSIFDQSKVDLVVGLFKVGRLQFLPESGFLLWEK